MPGGRPSKYQPVYCDEIIELSKEGASEDECAITIGVCPQTFENWKVAHPEFLDACTRASAARKVWWERTSRKVACDGGSAAMVIFSLTNIAPHQYASRKEVVQTNKDDLANLSQEELNDRIERLRRIADAGTGAGKADGSQ